MKKILNKINLIAIIIITIFATVACSNNKSKNTDDTVNINPLPIPPILEDTNKDANVADFTIEAQYGKTKFIDNKETNTMGYNGNYLGPVMMVNKGEKVNLHVKNNLDEHTTFHLHGLELPGISDGGPHQKIAAGTTLDRSFTINQPSATLWYHPHFIGSTATQVYKGLAGLIYVNDDVADKLNIPKEYGVNDIPLVIQDRTFDEDGQFKYDTRLMDGAIGDTIILNGAISPTLDVNTQKVRFRILNGANASNYTLSLSNKDAFFQIASDGGLLESPVKRDSIFISPGERVEVIVDFSKSKVGTKIELNNTDKNKDTKSIITFNVKNKVDDKTEIPDKLVTIDPLPKDKVSKKRNIELQGMGEMVNINGEKFDINKINFFGKQDEIEMWTITNPSSKSNMNMDDNKDMNMNDSKDMNMKDMNMKDMNMNDMDTVMGHPFHIHGTQFQIVSRNGQAPPPQEQGWKDTVYVNPDEEVKILVKFNNKGIYMYHCHILEHEEAGMMGQIKID